MNKKFLSLVLALVMVLGTFTSVFAAATTTTEVPKATSNEAKIQWLLENKIIEGRKVNADEKDNDLALTKNIQRAEVTKLLVYAIGKQDLAAKLQGVMKPYSDVEPSYWANGFITVGSTSPSPANGLPFLNGYPDGTFKPVKDVTYAELAKMLVVLVKKDLTAGMVEAANKAWPTQWMAWAAELGIFDGITVADSSKPANRHDSFVMIYNAMYKMKDLRVLPANETLGIISKATKGNDLVLNQGDFAKKYTVNDNTVFVSVDQVGPKLWKDVNGVQNQYYVGSLVRVLTDDEGVVTHIVELGNPIDGAINNDRAGWMGVADKTATEHKLPVVLGDLKNVTVGGVTASTNSLTRYFVADANKGALTEATKEEILTKYFNKSTQVAYNVYMGYDNSNGINQAKVVVFNKVDNGAIDSKLVRVVTPGNTNFSLEVENSGATPTTSYGVNVRDINNIFPLNYNMEKYDVIDLTVDGKDFVAKGLKIDYSEDDVFAISKVETKKIDNMTTTPTGYKTSIELVDKNGAKQTFALLIDTDTFFGNQLVAGAKVQIDRAAEANGVIEIISVVPNNTALKGILEKGVDARQETGVVQGSFDKVGDVYIVKVLVDGRVNNYVVSASEAKKFDKDALHGVEVTFKVDPAKYQDHGKGYAFDFEKSEAQLAKEAAEAAEAAAKKAAVEEWTKALNAALDLAPVKAEDKAVIEAAIDAYNKVVDAGVQPQQANIDKLNAQIQAWNDLDPASTDEDIELIK